MTVTRTVQSQEITKNVEKGLQNYYQKPPKKLYHLNLLSSFEDVFIFQLAFTQEAKEHEFVNEETKIDRVEENPHVTDVPVAIAVL